MGSGNSRVQRPVYVRQVYVPPPPTTTFHQIAPRQVYTRPSVNLAQLRGVTYVVSGGNAVQQNPVQQGVNYLDQGNDQQAVQCFLQGMQQDDPAAYFWYGWCHQEGRGVPPNSELAFQYYKTGIEKGDANCQYTYADALFQEGATKDQLTYAFSLFQAAAGQNHVDAQFKVGQFYEKAPTSGNPNIGKAIEWYRKASAGGSQEATARLQALGIRV